jgi:hypothetical protein
LEIRRNKKGDEKESVDKFCPHNRKKLIQLIKVKLVTEVGPEDIYGAVQEPLA